MLSRSILLAAAIALAAPAAHAAPVVGQAAPAFTAKDADGKTRSLSEFKGSTVVLEWTNDGCPYVQKHYKSGAMQGLQKSAAKDGVVWLTLISSAPGKQGYLEGAQARGWKATNGAGSTALLLDPTGQVGHAYEAKTTPHMFVIDGKGVLVYAGGIDDIRSANAEDIAKATNYVKAALADLKAGREVQVKTSRPYGCSVKYAD